jgi:hypothetical protein
MLYIFICVESNVEDAHHLAEETRITCNHIHTFANISWLERSVCYAPVLQRILVLRKEVSNISEPCVRVADSWKVTPELMLTEEGNVGDSSSPATRLIDV